LSIVKPLRTIPVGVIVERTRAESPWIDFLWRPVAVLPGVPETAPWTTLSDDGERARFYAGSAEVELYPSETSNYRDNLLSGAPSLWVGLRPDEGEPPYRLFIVTADPAEGEGLTTTGTDVVEPVPMPDPVLAVVEQFIAEHHVERVFFKRRRTEADPEALARRPPGRQTPRDRR
jgi:hypothetical protein